MTDKALSGKSGKKLDAKKMKKFCDAVNTNLFMRNPKLVSRAPLDKALDKMAKEMWKKYENMPKF